MVLFRCKTTDSEHRLLVGCLMTARNQYLHEDKPSEDVNELILKINDAPTKKIRVIKEGSNGKTHN
ncbi:MAG TPA: hypothetical protein DDZ53_03010 [Firmicutes bacterium]|nr:hypothetical protein [Bacillota bacterium]